MTATSTVPSEHAALIAAGVKTIITTAKPLPKSVRPGDRLLIHAGTRRPGSWKCPCGRWMDWVDDCWHCPRCSDESYPTDDVHPHPDAIWGPLPLGHIVASAILRDSVPILSRTKCPQDDTPHVCIEDDRLGPMMALLYPGSKEPLHGDDITAQLPYGDFTPGRWAWLLNDVKPTTERCPTCWGEGVRERLDGQRIVADSCQICALSAYWGTCPPIPFRGGPGIRRWEP